MKCAFGGRFITFGKGVRPQLELGHSVGDYGQNDLPSEERIPVPRSIIV